MIARTSCHWGIYSLLIFSLFPYFFTISAQQAPYSVNASLSNVEVFVGEWSDFQMVVRTPLNSPIAVPDFPTQQLSPFVDVQRIEPHTSKIENSQRIYTFTWRLWPIEAGQWQIPQIPIYSMESNSQQTQIINTPLLELTVLATLPTQEQSQLKDFKSSVEVPWSWKDSMWWYVVLITCVFLCVIAFWYYRHTQQQKISAIPGIPPHEVAFNKLRNLENFLSAHPDQIQSYYYQLSEIFREFLENRFLFPAMSLTTEELFSALERNTDYPVEDCHQIQFLSQKSDLIKFAEALPTQQEQEDASRQVIQWIERVTYHHEKKNENLAEKK